MPEFKDPSRRSIEALSSIPPEFYAFQMKDFLPIPDISQQGAVQSQASFGGIDLRGDANTSVLEDGSLTNIELTVSCHEDRIVLLVLLVYSSENAKIYAETNIYRDGKVTDKRFLPKGLGLLLYEKTLNYFQYLSNINRCPLQDAVHKGPAEGMRWDDVFLGILEKYKYEPQEGDGADFIKCYIPAPDVTS